MSRTRIETLINYPINNPNPQPLMVAAKRLTGLKDSIMLMHKQTHKWLLLLQFQHDN